MNAVTAAPSAKEKTKRRPALAPEYCKGCGRCVSCCAQGCLHMGKEALPATGLVPVALDLGRCTSCGLCIDACPEPYGLVAEGRARARAVTTRAAERPASRAALPAVPPLVTKGTYASAMGAILAGCRHFYGYPITPSTEGAELMAQLLPRLGGVFVQAVSEVAAVNMIYGCAAAGLPAMTFTSSPGFSLMLEGISYMIGSELPGVFVNVMRGGHGLGNIAPEQTDIKLCCRGLGHGNTHAIVLAPASPQEMLDHTFLAFELSFAYRNPVVVLCDGYLGQMTGKVTLPDALVRPGLPAWAVYGDGPHRANLVSSIYLSEPDLEAHNLHLSAKYARMCEHEQRAETFLCDDADTLVVACNTPARMAKGAVQELRAQGVRAGLFRPQTLWPFPVQHLLPLLRDGVQLVVVEASPGQLEDELRLALSHAGKSLPPMRHVRRLGGVLPSPREIVAAVLEGTGARA